MTEESKHKRSTVTLIMGYSLVSWTNAALAFLLIPVATRVFEPALLGKLNVFLSIVLVLYPLMSLGLNQGILRFVSSDEDTLLEKQYLSFSVLAVLLTTIALLVVVLLFWRPLSEYLIGEQEMLAPFAIVIITSGVALIQLLACWQRAHNSLVRYAILMVAFSLLTKFFHIILGALGCDYNQILLWLICASVSLAMIFLLVNYKSIARGLPARGHWKRILAFSFPLSVASVISMLNTYMPIFALNSYGEYGLVGIFSTAVTLSLAVNLIATGFNTFWPTYVFNNWQTRRNQIYKFHELVVLIIVSLAIVLIVLREPISFLLGAQYREALGLFPLLLISPISYVIGETTGIGLLLAKKSRLYIPLFSVAAVVNLVIALATIPVLHEYGAVLGSVISAVGLLAAKTILGEREFKSISSIRFLVGGMATFICFSVLITILNTSVLESFFVACIAFAVLALVFGLRELRCLIDMVIEVVKSYLKK